MDIALLTVAGAVITAFAGLVIFALRHPTEESGRIIEQMDVAHENLAADYERERTEAIRLRGELADCAAEKRQLEQERDECDTKCRQAEANLRACARRKERLEQQLIALGIEVDGDF